MLKFLVEGKGNCDSICVNRRTQSCLWRLKRVAASFRQLDICLASGISQTRYSALERGEAEATEAEREEIDRVLPALPPTVVEELLMEKTY